MADTKRTGKAIEPPQAIHDGHPLLLWIIPQLDKFPRLRRYTLGERIETLLLQVLERLLEAAYSSERDKRAPCCIHSRPAGMTTMCRKASLNKQALP